MTLDELEIIKVALNADISWQRNNSDLSKSNYAQYLKDTEALLRKVRNKIGVLKEDAI